MSNLPTLYAIDFGTSNSLLAAASQGRVFDPVPLDPEAADPTILRSILCFPDAGGVFVGVEALRQFIEHGAEGRLLRSIKHHLGSRSFRGTVIRGRLVSAEELVGALLRQMRVRADAYFETSSPSKWTGRPSTAKVPRIAAEIRRRLPAARMEQFKGFHSVVEGLAQEAQAVERA
jgi:hypothetical chaperone protein